LYFKLFINNIFALKIENKHGQRAAEEKELDDRLWVRQDEEDVKDEDLCFEENGF